MNSQNQQLEAEQAILGAIFLKPQVFTAARSLIQPDDFRITQNRQIFTAIIKVVENQQPIDLVAVKYRLKLDGSDIPSEYLLKLLDSVPTAANIEAHCNHLISLSCKRMITEFSGRLHNLVVDGEEIDSILSETTRFASQVADRRTSGTTKSAGQVAEQLWERFEKIETGELRHNGIGTGIPELDSKYGVMNPGDLIVLGARPGDGKTAFALQIADNVSEQKNVLFISAEMTTDQLVTRLLSSFENIVRHLATGRVNNWRELAQRLKHTLALKLWIDDRPRTNPSIIQAIGERLKQSVGLNLIVVDYIQILHSGSSRKGQNRYEEIGLITRSLKEIAKYLSIPVIALSQLKRTESECRKPPLLSDFRESGNIEQDADRCLALWHPYKYGVKKDEQELSTVGMCKVLCLKNRQGESGSINMTFDGDHTRFVSFVEMTELQQNQSKNWFETEETGI